MVSDSFAVSMALIRTDQGQLCCVNCRDPAGISLDQGGLGLVNDRDQARINLDQGLAL